MGNTETKKIIQKLTLLCAVAVFLILPTVKADTTRTNVLIRPKVININPYISLLDVNERLQLEALADYADNRPLEDITSHPSSIWTSSNPDIISVSSTGLLTGLKNGESTISISFNGTVGLKTVIISTASRAGGSPDHNIPVKVLLEKRHDTERKEVFTTSTNQSVNYKMEIRESGADVVRGTYPGITDDQGNTQITVNGLPDDKYDFSIKTISHLRKTIKNIDTIWPGQPIDFSLTTLFAGDVNSQYGDNVINGADLDKISTKIYSNNLQTDLNRDQIVNGIDLAITTKNFNKTGDQ